MTLPAPRLIALTDTTLAPGAVLLERLERLCRAAPPAQVMVQLRDRQLSFRERLQLGAALRSLTRDAGQWLAVNDSLDLAVSLDADAVHLGEGSFTAADARRLGARWVTRAWHDPDTLPDPDVDALLLSPVIAPRKGAPALGRAGLVRARVTAAGRCLFALGGIDERSAVSCLEAGADGVAVREAALDGRDPGPLLRALAGTMH